MAVPGMATGAGVGAAVACAAVVALLSAVLALYGPPLDAGTRPRAACQGGRRRCGARGRWGPCVGELRAAGVRGPGATPARPRGLQCPSGTCEPEGLESRDHRVGGEPPARVLGPDGPGPGVCAGVT